MRKGCVGLGCVGPYVCQLLARHCLVMVYGGGVVSQWSLYRCDSCHCQFFPGEVATIALS